VRRCRSGRLVRERYEVFLSWTSACYLARGVGVAMAVVEAVGWTMPR
jgi:hypothetical protein